ncbi:polysaccharide pyruvyl transferase family protein [Microbacterium invictum]|uniref:Polysaccharide pyruvyl transferase family protein n=1 Tax=Microbacterium invictum TaxID=515415 RepID=A0ABZ0VCH0_9MICO|nr:polysaccharide pyruvyl transferase family protein [Microbacterium invictum]WQB69825.1 polysaccharide pyruvyl transferase family protein [Microbacterium invictum]
MKIRHIRSRLIAISRGIVDRTGWTEIAVDRALRSVRSGTSRHVLIAPPGAGNIGDQAMVEAFVAAADREVIVVSRGQQDFVIPAAMVEKASLHALPGLFYGQGTNHRADLRRLAILVDGAATVSIIGADIMDGVYVQRPSLRRSAIAAACARAGIDTSVIGFSWSSKATPQARRALRRAGAAGARLLLRDPASAGRVRSLGVAGVVETADIVFTDDRRDDAAAEAILQGIDGPVALVNASGLIARSVDQVPEYAAVIRHLRGRGLSVILLPHVLRETADDRSACRAIFDVVDQDGVRLVDEPLSPSTIRALAAVAQVTITGRMHLAIMSLAQGTPAVTLATQGKVEGLMSLFDWPELCVAPAPGMAEDIIRVVDVALDAADTATRIRRGAEKARDLAKANVSRIGGDTGRTAGVAESGGRRWAQQTD